MFLPVPRFLPPLDPDFRPAALANRALREAAHAAGAAVPLVIGLERNDGARSRYETVVFDPDHPGSAANAFYVERLVKFLLWQRGGWKVFIGGPPAIGEHIRRTYAPGGARQFDAAFMGETVYGRPFTVVPCAPEDVPPAYEPVQTAGGYTDGFRLGFDLGASDLKVAAVANGEVVFTTEIVWEPRQQADPDYHYTRIREALRLAAAHLPRVDAIGGSSAGIILDNQPRVASLFRAVPPERYDAVRNLFLRLGREFGAPVRVINDGEVTALVGALTLGVKALLGVAMGSSEAAGYVTPEGALTDWLNELAFAPVDYRPDGPRDEWSQDEGVGSQYFSQQCVFRLAPRAGITLPTGVPDAERLRFVQDLLARGHEGARQIWESIGVFLGYTIAHYADFYTLEHVLILGRVTSGVGGEIIRERACQVLAAEFPDLAGRIALHLPDEKSRRLGQAVVAAGLPPKRATASENEIG